VTRCGMFRSDYITEGGGFSRRRLTAGKRSSTNHGACVGYARKHPPGDSPSRERGISILDRRFARSTMRRKGKHKRTVLGTSPREDLLHTRHIQRGSPLPYIEMDTTIPRLVSIRLAGCGRAEIASDNRASYLAVQTCT